MHQTTKMKAQEFSILYLGKDKHARTITSKILWQAKEENISKEKHADIHSCFISFKKKKASYVTASGKGSFYTNMYFFK
jgi:hypothetical protein